MSNLSSLGLVCTTAWDFLRVSLVDIQLGHLCLRQATDTVSPPKILRSYRSSEPKLGSYRSLDRRQIATRLGKS
jgi:alpha-D-ribose 1-methylphosphonate 5-triphosphate synthase subunit PhnI